MPYQRVNILGSTGRIKMDIPFSPAPNADAHIWLHTKDDVEKIIFEAVDQYTIQGDLFSKAIIDNTPVPTDLQDAVNNMLVIEAIFKSAELGALVAL
jgi:predicted dehydrogenase